MTQERKKLVELKNVSLTFNKGKSNEVKAIDDVSFDIYEGEIFGLVGESGSGKTTIGRSILKLYDIDSGTVTFAGNDISSLKGKDLHDFRKTAQMIFQDPQASLNGRMKIRDIIARALAVNPHFIVADEPISALDVSIQAQVVNLMQKLQHEQGLTYLFIAHDLSMVKYISDRIGVMHWGKLLEVGPADEIYHNPIHPYTKSLLSAIPEPDPERERKRQHLIYDSSIENDGEKRQMYEIRPGHFVYATEAEAKNYKEEA